MKKNLVMMLAGLSLAMGLTSCGGGKAPEAKKVDTFIKDTCYIEEAYRGDCWNAVTDILEIDGTNYTRIEDTHIVQQSGVVVTYWTYTMKGTYTVTSTDAENNSQVIALSKATEVTKVMNGAVTTMSDDDTLLDYEAAQACNITLDTSAYRFVVNA